MMHDTTQTPSLDDVFASYERASIAVSGGVDSMTLAYVAHLAMPARVTMFHAISPAVPESATARVKNYARLHKWRLRVLDAGEFRDENYLQNPANRCFFCKSNLYSTLSAQTDAPLFSGTNVDDLVDWRPGLKAAEKNAVHHPFVEAGLGKADIRALAARHGLNDLAELPSAPCLSSRVQTGIRINPQTLISIDQAETMLRDTLTPQTVRCRVRSDGVLVELDEATLDSLGHDQKQDISEKIKGYFTEAGEKQILFGPYRQGSAFLRETLKETAQ